MPSCARAVRLRNGRVNGRERLEVDLEGRREGRVEGVAGGEDGVASDFGLSHEVERGEGGRLGVGSVRIWLRKGRGRGAYLDLIGNVRVVQLLPGERRRVDAVDR
jgi:hypothetical protein